MSMRRRPREQDAYSPDDYRAPWSLMSDDLAPHWLWRSLHDLAGLPLLVLEVFVSSPFPASLSASGSSSCKLRPVFRVSATQHPPPVVSDWAVPSMRFRASSRHQRSGFAVTVGTKPPPPSALRFSQPLGGLLPVTPCGLISSRWHVQASPFRGFPSPGAATARRRSLALLSLPRTRLLLRGDPPVARLQGLAPLESP